MNSKINILVKYSKQLMESEQKFYNKKMKTVNNNNIQTNIHNNYAFSAFDFFDFLAFFFLRRGEGAGDSCGVLSLAF